MDVLPIVTHLHALCKDPANRKSIINDKSMLQSLILFLDNQNTAVIELALQVCMVKGCDWIYFEHVRAN